MFGWEKWADWLKTGFKDKLPTGIAKKIGLPTAAAGLVSYGLIATPPVTPPEECGYWCATKAWVNRHPAIAGALAGGAAGSVVPGVGTIVGIATGATIGYTVGSDERAARQEERM